MNILEKFIEKGKNSKVNIGIGLSESPNFNRSISDALIEFFHSNTDTIILYGIKNLKDQLLKNVLLSKYKSNLIFKSSDEPEMDIFTDLKSANIDAVIRGSFNSNLFIKALKKKFEILETRRLALLETFKKEQFFFGPVGIDECNSPQNKILFIESALKEFSDLNIIPQISVLSGGRISDIGREPLVDISIEDAKMVVSFFKDKYPNLKISHDEILIENAIRNHSNLVIAPNGISGNLIYRTLVHLGAGKAYGAIYMNLKKVIVDTSRVGDSSEILGALIMVKALSNR